MSRPLEEADLIATDDGLVILTDMGHAMGPFTAEELEEESNGTTPGPE